MFEHTWTELELWLEQLARLEPNQQETVIQFLERVSLPVFFFFLLFYITVILEVGKNKGFNPYA